MAHLIPAWVNEEFLAPTDGVLHLLVFEKSTRAFSSNVTTHVWSGSVPKGCFYELQSNVFVESPAFMFLHAASILDLQTLVAFGDELCGLYSFDRREKRGFRKRKRPLATKDQIGNLLAAMPKFPGKQRALIALQHVVERSASPMETFDEMTMCLPYRLGGYGIFPPIMNEEVKLTPKAARIARRKTCYLDMGYSARKLDIEHHGKHDHSSEGEQASDRARVNGLKEMNFEVIELTKDQVGDLVAYELIVLRVARILDKRVRRQGRGATPERLLLRKRLFAWNASSGRIR